MLLDGMSKHWSKIEQLVQEDKIRIEAKSLNRAYHFNDKNGDKKIAVI